MSLSEDSDLLSNSDIQIFTHMMGTLHDLPINHPNYDFRLNFIFDLYIRILHFLKLSFLDLSSMTRTMVNWDYCIHVSNFDDLQDQDLMFFDPGLGHQLKRRHLGIKRFMLSLMRTLCSLFCRSSILQWTFKERFLEDYVILVNYNVDFRYHLDFSHCPGANC